MAGLIIEAVVLMAVSAISYNRYRECFLDLTLAWLLTCLWLQRIEIG